jgi:hypothetical protein
VSALRPNKGLELTAYSLRCAPASGSSSCLTFGSQIPIRREGSMPLLDSMGLSKEGQPCKNSSLAEWDRELWGQSLLVRLGMAQHQAGSP